MAGLGLGVAFVGYSVFYYGLTQVQSQNFGFLDLVLPTRWSKIVTTKGPVNDDGTTYPLSPTGATPATKAPTVATPTNTKPSTNFGRIGFGSLPTPIK